MSNIPPDILEQIREGMQRPTGTVEFKYSSKHLFDPAVPGGALFEMVAGVHTLRLERDGDLQLRYWYSSPGTGTRVATIDLKTMPTCETLHIALVWSPDETRLDVIPVVDDPEPRSAKGVESTQSLRVGRDGQVYQVGDDSLEVMNVSVFRDGQPVLQTTAIEAWQDTVKAVRILASGTSEEGHIYEVVVCNLTLSVLVTGFEAYGKRRILELEAEGVRPDIDAVIKEFYSARERDTGVAESLREEADAKGISVLECIVSRKINFQNYKDVKKAFRRAYGIQLGELGVSWQSLQRLLQLIGYRHRVIHVSPLIGMLNQSHVTPDHPDFAGPDLAAQAINCFDEFVRKLHEATLRL